MKLFRLGLLSASVALTLLPVAHAQSLTQLYEMARNYDASYQSARSLYKANVSKADQATAQLLPTVNLGTTTTRSQTDFRGDIPALDGPAYKRWYLTNNATLTAVQPLYRPANMAVYLQSSKIQGQAMAQLVTAEQDLMVRVSQAYFDVLASQDSLAFVQAQKVAVAEQLASAKRNFEVGTATITDTREAQARYDLVLAQEIAAENDLRVKRLALDTLVGSRNAMPKPLLKSAELKPNLPDNPDTWVNESSTNHPSILNARLGLDIARLEIERARAGHKPTIDLQGTYSGTRNLGGTSISGSGSANSHVVSPSLQVLMTVPLFAGFATENRYKETVSLEDKARHDLEAAERNVAQATRAAYFGVVSGIGQVKALEAAESSSQVALDANKLGYSVGVRINIDVLNSQSQLFQTKRDLAKARYDVLVGGLKLRQDNGTLKIEDLQSVNALLAT
ncbi:MAG: TolC family outer membrane protein [Limnohabitans sp.]|nr:TolC family outer membrane protein [Limnohabitans sp.]